MPTTNRGAEVLRQHGDPAKHGVLLSFVNSKQNKRINGELQTFELKGFYQSRG
jgi:hypothetical protein